MPFSTKLKADYIEMINHQLDNIKIEVLNDFTLVQEFLLGIIDPLNYFSAPKYSEAMNDIREYLDSPENWVEDSSDYEEYRKIIVDRITSKIDELKNMSVSQKKAYIENLKKNNGPPAVGQDDSPPYSGDEDNFSDFEDLDSREMQQAEFKSETSRFNLFNDSQSLSPERYRDNLFEASHMEDELSFDPLNSWQAAALHDLSDYGLTAEMLLNRYENSHYFDYSHYWALRELVLVSDFTIADALLEISGLSSAQARGVQNGLSRRDIINLNSDAHISTLQNLKYFGLTSEMLLNRNENGHDFSSSHRLALQRLVIEKNYTIRNALLQIDGLSSTQAEGIKNGLQRRDVINLNNYWHISSLQNLKTYGLTASMLLNRNTNGHEFNSSHCWALEKLFFEKELTITDSLSFIDGLSQDEASNIEALYEASQQRLRVGL
ncbi:hypothetical protein N9L02_00055 [Gammaproteobacteria bacterium]|nr:hypothetical protein [Gammaproteobacteria bacterium]